MGFPAPEQAIEGGLLAAGGDLTPEWLLTAYANGIFPWFDSDEDHIFWWSPQVRAVISPGHMRVTRSLRQSLRKRAYRVTFDTTFEAVVEACAGPRRDSSGTWITANMRAAYQTLHQMGYAHCVEVWDAQTLVGGLYGVNLGDMFFGESMFAQATDASKIAFLALHVQLQRWRFGLIDCQIMNPHLHSLGVRDIERSAFLATLEGIEQRPTRVGRWRCDDDIRHPDGLGSAALGMKRDDAGPE